MPNTSTSPEGLLTLAQAAEALGVHLWAIRRAVKRGSIPSYTPFNSRRLVRLSEVLSFIDASKVEGA
ncbi:helix-turn-helix transcriptional regulator [Ancylobacter aquaticus]|uniref:helix-turn-helix transcriptional regulator n=1 Tax=Ancylobacter aquaticus TaxID=100 RepID=UPI001043BD8B|nr:helix-turn-helix domain-containing protein [Ancylobacter aquaticus]